MWLSWIFKGDPIIIPPTPFALGWKRRQENLSLLNVRAKALGCWEPLCGGLSPTRQDWDLSLCRAAVQDGVIFEEDGMGETDRHHSHWLPDLRTMSTYLCLS